MSRSQKIGPEIKSALGVRGEPRALLFLLQDIGLSNIGIVWNHHADQFKIGQFKNKI